jgi:ABC-2 type transport system permease protein
MMASLKSELRKLWTVRSTYFILLFALAIMGIFAFWVEGIKAGVGGNSPVTDGFKTAKLIRDAVTSLGVFGAIVGILTFTHEYRYNTISYTLTASRSRLKSLLAKIISVSIFAILFTVYAAVMATILMHIALAIKGYHLSPQYFPHDLWWRVVFVGWGYAMIGLLIAAIIRQQVGSIVAFLLFPTLIEQIVGGLLRNNRIYLPFTALQQVTGLEGGGNMPTLSHNKAALVFVGYLLVGWLIAGLLFIRRDAN